MTQVEQFVDSLKRTLKSKNITYKNLARNLDLSESSVKRILSDKSLSLERIETICEACDISFNEICKNAHFEDFEVAQRLSAEDEVFLSSDIKMVHLFLMLTDGLSLKKIEADHDISKPELRKLLLKLDRRGFLELHPEDKVKLKKYKKGVLFNRTGPIGKLIGDQMKSSYLQYHFDGPLDHLRLSSVHLSEASLQKFKRKIDKFMVEIQDESRYALLQNSSAPEVGFLLAFRPWSYRSLEAIKKKKN